MLSLNGNRTIEVQRRVLCVKLSNFVQYSIPLRDCTIQRQKPITEFCYLLRKCHKGYERIETRTQINREVHVKEEEEGNDLIDVGVYTSLYSYPNSMLSIVIRHVSSSCFLLSSTTPLLVDHFLPPKFGILIYHN